MKKVNLIVSLVGILITITCILLTISGFKKNYNITIFSEFNTYPSKYAKKHFINQSDIANKELNSYNLFLEEFDYNVEDNSIEIKNYKGKSEELVIPEKIDGRKVTSIAESFNNKSVKTLIISKNITNIDTDILNNYEIKCYKNDFCESIKDNENNNVTILNDSDYVNFNNTLIEYEYTIKDNQIEINDYLGLSNQIVIPKAINGYRVKSINYDFNNINKVFIPSSVEKINSSIANRHTVYIIVLVSFIAALILFIINNITLFIKDLESLSKNVIMYIVSGLYLIIMCIIAKSIADYNVIPYKVIIKELFITIVYELLIYVLKLNKRSSEKFETNIKKNKLFINDCLMTLEKNDKHDKYKLKDVIKYSDPMSNEKVEDIEKEILDLLKSLNDKNAEKIKELFKERNNIIKNNK